MEKIPCLFSQDIFTSPVIPACHGDSDCLKSPGESSFFKRLWISNSDLLLPDGSNRRGQFAGFW
jgi:hypothetical protein